MKKLILSLFILSGIFASPFLAARDAVPAPLAQQVNINTASAEVLAKVLTGVGLSKAQEIVNHRNAYGEFQSVDDLVEVKGIGERIVSANEARILINN